MSSLAEEDWEFFTLAIAKLVTELDDPVHTQRLAETIRRSSSAKAHEAFMRAVDQIDLRPILPALEMPVLVVHDTGFPFGSFELCQDLAASLPDARFVVIAADRDAEIDAIDTFLRGGSGEPEPTRPTPSQAGSFRTMAAPAAQPQSFSSGRYVVSKLLGEGGQKIVFLARDTQLDRDVAIALLKAEGIDDASLARLKREARALAHLEAQPHIVAIYDIGDHERRPFTVCEYLAGGSLEEELARAGGPLPVERAVAIAQDVCRALIVAHGSDIIHRDIKPSNIWLTASGNAKLGDFGLATALGRSHFTQTGTVMGTAAYMAPEQALGQEADQRSDIYALGCVLYEMLAGRPPFVADTAVAVVSQHINASPVPLSGLQPDLAPALERIVMQMLAKAPEDRPQTAAEVLGALEGNAPTTSDAPSRVRTSSVVAEPQIQYAKTSDGVSIAFAVAGGGPPLVYVRMWTAWHVQLDWQGEYEGKLYEALAAKRRLITFDRRGAGLSDRGVSELTLEKFTLDLEAVVDHLGLERFALMGWAFGMMVSTIYALRHPERVSAIISLNGVMSGSAFWQSPRNRAMRAMRETDFDTYVETMGSMNRDPHMSEIWRASITPQGQKAFVDASDMFDVTDLVSQLKLPVLLLYPADGRDAAALGAFAREMATRIPGGRLVALPWESWEAFGARVVSAIDAFLSEDA